jgi:superfamily I DNA/RNA helicase
MELQQSNRNSELAKQEWKPLRSGNAEANVILQARSTQSLRLRHEEDIKQVLRYAMVLVGLRGNNMPSEEEKFVLLNFIRSNFGNQTPEEIKLAFEWAVSGKLNIDAKCYENFSCEYFGRIMKAYIDYARQETITVVKEIEAPKEIPSDADLKMAAINSANMYSQEMIRCHERNIKMNWLAGGLHVLYDYIVKFGIYEASLEDKNRIYSTLRNKFTNKEELVMACKAQAYKEFIENLADFKAYLTEAGKIEPID